MIRLHRHTEGKAKPDVPSLLACSGVLAHEPETQTDAHIDRVSEPHAVIRLDLRGGVEIVCAEVHPLLAEAPARGGPS